MKKVDLIAGNRYSEFSSMSNRTNKPSIRAGNILIPDISGYTQFVRKTDLATGNQITQRLLSAIMNSNRLDLQLSEVEGDALLLYKYGRKLTAEEILLQYEEMLLGFETESALICEELGIHLNLSLKLIAHYGRISEYSICNFRKLYGQSVLEAHKLLKNSVDSDTYVLITTDLLEPESVDGVKSKRGTYSGQTLCEIYGDEKSLCYQVFDYKNESPMLRLFELPMN